MAEVLVVRAGPTGLVMAIPRRRFGVACRVIDRASAPATTSRTRLFHGTGHIPDLGGLGPRVQLLTIGREQDPAGALVHSDGAEAGALILVRPDGYVGDRGDVAALRRYLARALAGPAKVSPAGG